MVTSPLSSSTENRHSCCIASALEDADATYCIECGKPLMRCMAFQECGGIVDESGLCPVCVQPHLEIIPGATMKAAVGGSVAVPFYLKNDSKVDRPLFIKGIWSRERGEWREERLGWEKLAPGERAQASATACEMSQPGLHEIEIMWAVTTQWRTREEHYAFSTRLLIEIAEASSDQPANIQISSQNQMNGTIIQIDPHGKGGSGSERLVEAIDMKVRRLEKEERQLGLRSIDGNLRFSRAANFEFTGFAPEHAPTLNQPIVTPDAMLVFGRAHSRAQGGDTDVRLLVTNSDGEIDEEKSVAISRRHFEVYAENSRPMLRVAGGNGLRVNGKAFGPDKKVMLQDGDVIAPLVDAPEALSLSVGFRRELSRVTQVVITRTPPGRGTNP
ncbi:FHA domain-containing protein [Erythrobacter sp. THAF29]|uniref:FHA domain-containing protein n=1 Tax=Erythrobacter sp. THAF29 TaxID=2587851 RepID=UPI0012A82C7C|nr:FHA domain-containing protein [Erythrobacter sp. THAF29]QFT78690.1 FHA domain protein [Erythrobacter sp. THAF29]